MTDEVMEAPAQAPEKEREGVPGSEVLGLAANTVGWVLVALGGMWVWVAVGAAALAGGGLLWRRERKRRRSRTPGSSGRSGTGRSLGLGPTGRGSSGRGGRGGLGRLLGRGRGAGRGTGAAASGSPTGRKGRRGNRTGKGPDGPGAAKAGRRPGRRGKKTSGRGTGPSGGRGGSSGAGTRGDRRARRANKKAAKQAIRNAKRAGKRGGWSAPDPRRGDTKLLLDSRKPRPGPDKTDPKAAPGPKAAPKPGTGKPGEGGAPPTTAPRARAPLPHPHRNPHRTNPKGLTIMGRFGRMWREHSEEELSAASRYDPDTMPDYYTDLQELITAFQNQAAALGKMSAITQADLPVDANIAEYIAQLQSLMHTIAEGANETVGQFLKHHDADMARHNAPRVNEKKWNVP